VQGKNLDAFFCKVFRLADNDFTTIINDTADDISSPQAE
jgi:hypothetical protein